TAADVLDALNAMLGDPESAVGPSYFMSERARTRAGLERIWRTAIMPLLEERFAGGDVDVHDLYSLKRVLAQIENGIDAGPSTAPTAADVTLEQGDVLGGEDSNVLAVDQL